MRVVLSAVVPLVFVWIAFTLTYWCIPNTKVELRAALLGALIAGSAWLAAVHGYGWYARNSNYTKIYGSLAAIPVFLFWMYLTWIIVLLGAELAFAVQHVATYRKELEGLDASQSARELLALRLVCEVARRFILRRPPATADDLASELHAAGRLVNELTDNLVERGVLRRDEEDHSIVPAIDPHVLTPADLFGALRDLGEKNIWIEKDTLTRELEVRTQAADDAARRAWANSTIADLAMAAPAPRPAPVASDPRQPS